MHIRYSITALVVFAICFGVAATAGYRSPGAVDDPGTSEVCLDCHDDVLASLAGSVHEIRLEDPASGVSCTGCHVGDVEKHIDDDSYKLALTM